MAKYVVTMRTITRDKDGEAQPIVHTFEHVAGVGTPPGSGILMITNADGKAMAVLPFDQVSSCISTDLDVEPSVITKPTLAFDTTKLTGAR